MIITVTPTIMSGTVVRWYMDEYDAYNSREFLSTSREQVILKEVVIKDPEKMMEIVGLIGTAVGVMNELRAGKSVEDMATHQRSISGDITEVR